MGIKGFYGYCSKKIPGANKNVNIIEEINRFKE